MGVGRASSEMDSELWTFRDRLAPVIRPGQKANASCNLPTCNETDANREASRRYVGTAGHLTENPRDQPGQQWDSAGRQGARTT